MTQIQQVLMANAEAKTSYIKNLCEDLNAAWEFDQEMSKEKGVRPTSATKLLKIIIDIDKESETRRYNVSRTEAAWVQIKKHNPELAKKITRKYEYRRKVQNKG